MCAINVSSGLLLSPSRLGQSTQRAMPRKIRAPHPVAADDDLLDSFKQSAGVKPVGFDDEEPEVAEPTLDELVAKMPQYEKVSRHRPQPSALTQPSALCHSPQLRPVPLTLTPSSRSMQTLFCP